MIRLGLFLILAICIGTPTAASARASEGVTALDLSALPWTVSIEGRQGAIATAPFEEALDALMTEFEYADVAVFEVTVPITEDHLSAPHAFILGPIHIASEVYFDGQLVGRSGNISHQGKDYLGLATGRQTQVFLLPDHIRSPGHFVLRIRAQARVYSPGPVHGPRILLPVGEAIAMAGSANRIHYIAETMWVTATLLVVAFVFFRVGARFDPGNRDRWLPFLLLAGLGVLGVQTYIFNDLGFLTPLTLRIGFSLPAQFILLLHVYAALGVERPVWQTITIASAVLFQTTMTWWDESIALYLAKDLLVLVSSISIVFFITFAARKASRMGHRVSVWTYGYVFYQIISITAYPLLAPVMDLLIDPGLILVLLGVFILALAAIDHARWEREAVASLTQDLLHSSEQERGRLARELHDGLSHRLALIRMRLESVARASSKKSKAMVETIDELRQSSEELSGIVEGLRPLSLTGGNLQVALEAFADRWTRMSEITVDTQIEADVFPEEETQLHLLRIAQEAVQNAVRHGNASHISVTLKESERHLTLLIKDNGKGFQLETTNSEKGVGLTAMKQRMELLNGTLHIESSIAEGTTVRAEVSLT